jgi:3-dehydroquinate dehydratase-1
MTNASNPQIVGVISSRADFRSAVRMRTPPDFFELRLDAAATRLEEIRGAIGKLQAPLIITARHPREGGFNELSSRERHDLLREFLPHATCVDIEMRSGRPLAAILEEARRKDVRTIISFHDFTATPSRARLDEIARRAQSLGADFLKIATRVDTAVELNRLLDFYERHGRQMRIAAMGIGRLGRISRLEFARRGSALNYAYLAAPQTAGQFSIAQLRRAVK